MFERLELITADSILSLMAAFRADPDPRKVDLGVGVYRDDRGETPIPAAVRAAESALLARQTTKTYVGPAGNLGFNAEIARLALGAGHDALGAGRVRTIQTPGGCGALRLSRVHGARECAHLGESRSAPLGQRDQARDLSLLRCRKRRGAVPEDAR